MQWKNWLIGVLVVILMFAIHLLSGGRRVEETPLVHKEYSLLAVDEDPVLVISHQDVKPTKNVIQLDQKIVVEIKQEQVKPVKPVIVETPEDPLVQTEEIILGESRVSVSGSMIMHHNSGGGNWKNNRISSMRTIDYSFNTQGCP